MAGELQKHWVARGMAHGARIIVNQLEEEAPLLFNGHEIAHVPDMRTFDTSPLENPCRPGPRR